MRSEVARKVSLYFMRKKIQKVSRYTPSIFQGRIDFGATRRSISLTVEHPAERMAMKFSFFAIAALGVAYAYLVAASIVNVIERKEALAESATLANEVSRLEEVRLAAAEGLGPEEGARLGLVPVASTGYVHRPGGTASAALESNEI